VYEQLCYGVQHSKYNYTTRYDELMIFFFSLLIAESEGGDGMRNTALQDYFLLVSTSTVLIESPLCIIMSCARLQPCLLAVV
jgi:hypothetical protein